MPKPANTTKCVYPDCMYYISQVSAGTDEHGDPQMKDGHLCKRHRHRLGKYGPLIDNARTRDRARECACRFALLLHRGVPAPLVNMMETIDHLTWAWRATGGARRGTPYRLTLEDVTNYIDSRELEATG